MAMSLSSMASRAPPPDGGPPGAPGVPGASGPVGGSHGGGDSTFLGSILHGNPIFSAGFGLMLMGGALAYGRQALRWGAHAAQRRMLVSLEIPSKDRAHPWFLHWMGAQAAAQALRQKAHGPQKEGLLEFLGLARSRRAAARAAPRDSADDPLRAASGEVVSPIRILSRELAVDTQYEEPRAGDSERGHATFSLVPGPGTHWFRYHGVWMRLHRERNGKMVDLSNGAPWETVTLTTLASYEHLFTQLLHDARQLALASTHGKTIVYTSWGVEWRPFGHPRRVRELDSVVLPPNTKEEIVHDVHRFLSRGAWYAKRGIPYRRGYLLHGAPGSGKTSFITALAGSLDFNICLLNLAERGMTDDKLNFLMSSAPERSILLLEDVDAAFLGRHAHEPERHADGYQPSVTFSGLLNALDGVASGESRIIFMTTNHLERLDPALIRPGRVDMICELGDADAKQVRELLVRFYQSDLIEARVDAARRQHGIRAEDVRAAPQPPDVDAPYFQAAVAETATELAALADTLVAHVDHVTSQRRAALGLDETGHVPGTDLRVDRRAARGGVSMAELQGLFIRYPDDPRQAVAAFAHEHGLTAP